MQTVNATGDAKAAIRESSPEGCVPGGGLLPALRPAVEEGAVVVRGSATWTHSAPVFTGGGST